MFTKNKIKDFIILILVVLIIVFLIGTVTTKLYTVNELRLETMGVFFGAIITSLVTYFLLMGQSSAEEAKERNVRVFEEKSKKFNKFIDKLWEVWEDRKVSLKELHEIMTLLSKDIILYTNSKILNQILEHLNKIAEYAHEEDDSEKLTEKDKKEIGDEIFKIINLLAIEINLGGKIDENVKEKLDELEKTINPYFKQKEALKEFESVYIKDLQNIIKEKEVAIFPSSIEYNKEEKILLCRIGESNVYLRIWDIERGKLDKAHIAFFVRYEGNDKYGKMGRDNPYRQGVKGWSKHYLKGIWWNQDRIINFNDKGEIDRLLKKYRDKNYKGIAEGLADKIVDFYTNWKIGDKDIESIIKECEGEGVL